MNCCVTVFEFVIMFDPDEDELCEPTIVAEGKFVARDLEKARMIAATKIPEEYLHELDNIEVLVRPF